MSLLMQQLLRALMEEEKPKQFGDLMSVEAPSMIPSHEEGGGYSPSYHGDERKLYRSPTLDERLLLYPGQALESIKDVITRPSDRASQSWVTEALGKIPEAAWSVLDPLIEQTGKDVTQAYSGITEKDQGKKLATVTALTSMMMGMKPPKKVGGGRRTKFTNKEVEDFIQGVGPDPARNIGVSDELFEAMNTDIEGVLSSLETENLPRFTYPGNPSMLEDANNVTNKWRNMFEDWYSWGIQDSEQVTRGISPHNRIYTVPTGEFDADGTALFKTVNTQEAAESALAKAQFDMRREMGEYFTYEPARGALPRSEMTESEKKYSDTVLADIQSDKAKLSGQSPLRSDGTSHPVFGSNVFSEDGTQLLTGPDQSGVEAGKFLDVSEEVEIPEALLMSDNAWGRYSKWHEETYGRPFVRPFRSDHGILYRISSPEEVKQFARAAGRDTQKYLLNIGLGENPVNPESKEFDKVMFSALAEVEGDLYGKSETQRKVDVNTPEGWAEKAGKEMDDVASFSRRFPLLTRQLSSNDQRANRRVGWMIVDALTDNDDYNSMLKELEAMYGELGPENLREYREIVDENFEREMLKKIGIWWERHSNLSWRNKGTIFGETPNVSASYWGPGKNPWVNR